MPNRDLKLKQASAVLGVPPKDLQNFVQSGVLRPRRVGALYYFDRKALVSAKVALYLKDSLGASTRYLTQFTRAVSKVPGFATGEAEAVRVQSGARDERPVSILIPLQGQLVRILKKIPDLPDRDDAPFCECAESADADFIVTLNPNDFPQSRLKAKVILPSDPLPPRRRRARPRRRRLVIRKR